MVCVTEPSATVPSTSLSSDKEQIAVSAPSQGQKDVSRATEPPVHTSLPTTQISSISQVYNMVKICHLARQGAITELLPSHT